MLENDINIKDNMLASIHKESYDKEDFNNIIVSSGGSGSSQLTVSQSNETNEGPITTTEPQPATTITATTTASTSSKSAATTVNSDEEEAAAARRRAEWPLTGITEPGMNDCLYGRGSGISRHPGNKQYLKLVEERKEKYLSSKRYNRVLVALEILNELRSLNPPCRFLKQDEATNLWNDVGDKKAQEKISLALRGKYRVRQFEVALEGLSREDVSQAKQAAFGPGKMTQHNYPMDAIIENMGIDSDNGAFSDILKMENADCEVIFAEDERMKARDRDNKEGSNDKDAGKDAVDEGEDDESVSSTKSYYRDLCVRLTFALEKKNATEMQTRIENSRLREEIAQLRR